MAHRSGDVEKAEAARKGKGRDAMVGKRAADGR